MSYEEGGKQFTTLSLSLSMVYQMFSIRFLISESRFKSLPSFFKFSSSLMCTDSLTITDLRFSGLFEIMPEETFYIT